MPSINEVYIVGHLGRDPDLKEFESGGAVANFSVATSRSWKDKRSDEWVEETTWHRVVAFGDKALYAARRLDKGALVAVLGSYESREFVDKNGLNRVIYEVKARRIIPLEKLPNAGGGDDGGGHAEDDAPF